MTPTILTEDAIRFFAASGWHQFFLNEQFIIAPPYTALAKFCDVPPATLEDKPFTNLFNLASREKLRLRLRELTSTPAQSIASLALTGTAQKRAFR